MKCISKIVVLIILLCVSFLQFDAFSVKRNKHYPKGTVRNDVCYYTKDNNNKFLKYLDSVINEAKQQLPEVDWSWPKYADLSFEYNVPTDTSEVNENGFSYVQYEKRVSAPDLKNVFLRDEVSNDIKILIFFTRDHFGDNIIFNGVYNYSMDKETGHKLRALFRFKKQTIRCWNNELAMNPCQCPVIEIIYQQSGEMFVRVSTFKGFYY